MARVEFRHVGKVFPGGVRAVDDLSLEVEHGEFLVIVGPSGCGKSTVLRLVAGLEEVSSGDISVDGTVVNDKTPQQRNVAMVFQNYALYPHKTVRKNLEFPLRMMGLSRKEREERIGKVARLLELRPLLDRKPTQLSGGQRQRAAMGRALVRDPQVFLMDEPLSNLDAKLRVDIRTQIADLQRKVGISTIYVTHDQVEAMTLGDRVAVLKDGKLQQVAAASELYSWPVNVFVATFIGSPRMNIIRSSLWRRENELRVAFGDQNLLVRSEHGVGQLGEVPVRKVLLGLRPEGFVEKESVGEDCHVSGTVQATETLGHERIVYFKGPASAVTDSDVASTKNGRAKEGGAEEMGPGKGSEKEGEAGDWASLLVARLRAGQPLERGARITLGIDTTQLHFFGEDGRALRACE